MTQVRGCRSSRLEICWLLHVDRIFLRDACLKRDRPVLNHTGQPRILVPSMRLELIRLSSPPPQDGVSTNFTTKALFIESDLHQLRKIDILLRNLIFCRSISGFTALFRCRSCNRSFLFNHCAQNTAGCRRFADSLTAES